MFFNKNITNILGSIDKKIEINKKKIEKLEALARDIYDYWFVQYDFPDENGKPYKSSGGNLVWNDELKRNIPVGWKIDNLYAIADFINGIACQKYRPKNNEGTLPVIKIKEMHNGITPDTEIISANIPENYKIENGDILFSWSATLEVKYWTGGIGGLNQHIFKVVPKAKNLKEYCYRQIENYINIFKRIAEARKTTMGHITTDHLNQSIIVIPPSGILNNYSAIISPFVSQIIFLNCQVESLISLKMKLLPLLMNGQITII